MVILQDRVISEAMAATEQFFQDPIQRQLYWQSERDRMDRLSMVRHSKEEGREEGREEEREENILSALQMLPLSTVTKIFKQSPDYVRDVARRHGVVVD